MQTGLNIGIGSWIDRQQQGQGLPAFPATAIPFKLEHLSDLSKPEDLVRAVELSLLANRIDGNGWMYAGDTLPAYLWDRHRDNIADMETALSTLSPAEQEALTRADAILFEQDGFTISGRFAMYNETRRIHEDLVLQGASVKDVQLAYQNWITIGHKAEVEEALAIKTSLSRGTSRLIAASDVTRIDVALESLGSDVAFAPTFFSPISAVSTDHWTEAEVDLQALEESIRPEVSHTAWRRFRGKKNGKVRFRFVVVELHRPWFSTTLYEKDDWRLADDHDGLVADGIGQQGRLPAFYSRIYMAQVQDITYEKPRPRPEIPIITAVKPNLMQGTQVPALISPPSSNIMLRRAKRAGTISTKRRGVVATRRAFANELERHRPNLPARRPSRLESAPHIKIGTAGHVSIIQKLTTASAINKLSFAQAVLAGPTLSMVRPDPTQDRTTYLVAFGRTNMPACPNPNPNYQWP